MFHFTRFTGALALTTVASWSSAAIVQEQRITPTPRITSQIFGLTLDFDGSTIAVGAGFENNTFTGAGAAYLYTKSATWTQQLRMFDPAPELGAGFGTSVEVDGTRLLVSAPGHSAAGVAGAGRVYSYEGSGATWSLVQTIEPTAPIDQGFFGDIVAVDGDLAAFGGWASAFPAAGGFADRRVSIYERISGQWQFQATLAAPAAYSTGFTGTADLAVDNGRIFVGGSRELTPGGIDAGAVFVYEKNGGVWQQTSTIRPANTTGRFEFGASVAADGGRLAVGAEDETEAGLANAGAVYLYALVGANWTQTARVTSNVLDDNDHFGVEVSLSGNTLIVGAHQPEFPPFVRHGYAKVFHLSGNSVSAPLTLNPSDGEPHDYFGWAVAAAGDRAIVAAPFESLNKGAGYIYTGIAPPCPADLNGDGVVNLSDLGTVLSNFGSTGPGLAGDFDADNDVDLSDLGVILSAYGVPCG